MQKSTYDVANNRLVTRIELDTVLNIASAGDNTSAEHDNVSGDLVTVVQDDFADKVVLDDELLSNGLHLELNTVLLVEL